MNLVQLTLWLAAFVCFVLATWNGTAPYWNKLLAAGAALAMAGVLAGILR